MSHPRTAANTLEQEFLQIRAKILELAASLDRLDRAQGDLPSDERMEQIREGLTLLSSQEDRAEQVQLLFSLPYDDDWQNRFDLRKPK